MCNENDYYKKIIILDEYEDVFGDYHYDEILFHSTGIGKVYQQRVYNDEFGDYYYH